MRCEAVSCLAVRCRVVSCGVVSCRIVSYRIVSLSILYCLTFALHWFRKRSFVPLASMPSSSLVEVFESESSAGVSFYFGNELGVSVHCMKSLFYHNTYSSSKGRYDAIYECLRGSDANEESVDETRDVILTARASAGEVTKSFFVVHFNCDSPWIVG